MSTTKVRLASKRRYITVDTPNGSVRMLHRAIIGLKVAPWSALNFPDHLRDGDRGRIDEIDMPRDLAVRLYAFAVKHFMKGELDYYCYSFMRYMMNWGSSTDLAKYDYTGWAADPEQTEPFEPHVMYRDYESVHGLITVGRQVNLSVIGNNQPLVLARTTDLMELYAADKLLHAEATL